MSQNHHTKKATVTEITMPYWIQSADFQSADGPAVDLREAVRILQNHGWSGELERQRELEASAAECCQPGIGFVPGDGRILHICPLNSGTVLLHYHFMQKQRLLGLFPYTTQSEACAEHLPVAQVPDAIALFYHNDHNGLLALCTGAKPRR